MMAPLPLVSVVIPTFNSSKTIRVCIASILAQTYKNVEIIVVDNYSRDATREVANELGVKLLVAGPERSRQVNLGTRSARGDYVYRVDSDFFVGPNVIRECVDACERDGLDGMAVYNVSDPSVSLWSRVRKVERDVQQNSRSSIAVRFVKRPVWLYLGGLDEHLTAGEDYDFHERFLKGGYNFGVTKWYELHLDEPRTLAEVATKHYYYGKSVFRYVRKTPFSASAQMSPFRILRPRNRTFFNDPEIVGAYAVYQLVRYTATLLGFISTIRLFHSTEKLTGDASLQLDSGLGEWLGGVPNLPGPARG